MTTDIVTTGDQSQAIDFLSSDLEISPKVLQAQFAFSNKKIPVHAIKERAGAGGIKIQYVDHVFATEAVQDGLLPTWSFDLIDWEYFDDTSVLAITKFTYHMPYRTVSGDIAWVPRSVTEAGNYINSFKLKKAQAIAAATSRGLVRCLMRFFGFGIQFYKKGEDITVDQAWTTLMTYATNHGVTLDEVREARDKLRINRENLVDRFLDLFEAVGTIAKSKGLVKYEDNPAPQQPAPVQQPKSAQVVEEPTMEQTIEAEVKTEIVVFDNWDKIDEWLKKNNIDPSDVTASLNEKFGAWDPSRCVEYHKFLAEKFKI